MFRFALVQPDHRSARRTCPRGTVFVAHANRSYDGHEHLALVRGDVDGPQDVLVRVHSECLTGGLVPALRGHRASLLGSRLRQRLDG